jgi:D-sedoheptulose 7-phosphate isomerase
MAKEGDELMFRGAVDYLEQVSRMMLDTQVTNREGAALGLDEGAEAAVQMIVSLAGSSHKAMLAGNGGSAAMASHIQNDLCKAVGVRALVFTEQPLLMALANDDGYETIFEMPVRLWAQPGDLMIGLSSSGRSENILRAVRASQERQCGVITLSGFSPDNPLRRLGDLNFYVDSDVYGYVETAHAALAHFMVDRAASLIRAGADGEGLP